MALRNSLLSIVMTQRLQVEIKYKSPRLGSRRARQDLLVPSLFLMGEVVVAMIGNAFDHAAHASAGDALLARYLDPDACLRQSLDDRYAGGHGDAAPRLRQLHLEGTTARIDLC